ncbi:methyltransferase [Candidatus Dojkabacteria bacterium]|uniref:Methyltransferase n=1 Tax=Candidatus Dojkabacteria bacterium TaxID=2099670 RepID=A0A847ETL0_9BACT|nr:methyltransferase [Candidatus Dojkabacteria bacterium]
MSLKFDSSKKLRKEKTKHKVESWEDFEQREQAFLKERFLSKEPTISASVRVTGGKAKNFKIDIPRNTRPLTDRMKVRIFDAIGKDIANKTILDLYAGAGSFALESLSRGAKEATLVDASKQADLVIRKNIAHTVFLPQAEVIKSKVEDFIAKNKDTDRSWDIIFMDPPYKLYNTKRVFKMQEVINQVSEYLPGVNNVKGNKFKGALIIKHPRRYPIDTLQFEHIKKVDTYEFGLNSISLYIVK